MHLASMLHRETKGNPLFLGEAVRLLAAENRLEHLTDPASLQLAVPVGVRDAIGKRIAHLDEECRRALSFASVLGTEFGTETLRRMSDTQPDALLDVLDRVAEAGLVVAVAASPGQFRFSHDLVRETLYREPTPANRMRLHRRAAEAIRTVHGDDAAHLAELARHFFEAAPLGDPDTAVDYARRAGDEAARSLAYEEAARLYRMALQALDLAEPRDDRLVGELLIALGEAEVRAGDLEDAKDTFLRAAANARRIGDAAQLARAALGYGGRFMWQRAGDDVQLVPLLKDALVLLGGDDDRLRVRLLTRLAGALRSSPDRANSDAFSRQAVDLARTLDDPVTLGHALTGRCWAINWPENPEERLELANELVRVAETSADPEIQFHAHHVRCMFLMDVGAIDEAWTELNAMARRSKLMREPLHEWPVRGIETSLRLLRGDYARAAELIEHEVLPGHPEVTVLDDESVKHIYRLLLAREQGGVEELEEDSRRIIERFPWYPMHRAALACLLLDLDRPEEARAVFDELSTDGFKALYRDCEWLLGMAFAGEACARLRSADAARALYDQLLPFAGRQAWAHVEGSVGSIDRYLGLLAWTMGRYTEAIGHLRDGIRTNDGMAAWPWTAHTRADLAKVLLERDAPGDREEAASQLRSALETVERLGMPVLAREIETLGVQEPVAAGAVADASAVCRREGEYWTVVFDGDAFRLKDAKGLLYLAKLLAEPGREFHVLDLVSESGGWGGRDSGGGGPARSKSDALGDAGALLDPQAKAEYKRRLDDLQEELEDAEAMGDADRAERARAEREFIAHELGAAVGLGGRDRTAASASERARVNVTRAVKAALARIAEHSPALGAHLEKTVRTGTFCAYEPDPRAPISWQL